MQPFLDEIGEEIRRSSEALATKDWQEQTRKRAEQRRFSDSVQQPKRRASRVWYFAAALLVAVASGVVIGDYAQPFAAAAHDRPGVVYSAARSCVANAEGSPEEAFSSRVMTLESQYPAVFGGAIETACSVLDVYAVQTAAGYPAMLQAIQATSDDLPYVVIPVSNSLVALTRAGSRVASLRAITSLGYRVTLVYPNVALNQVDVDVDPVPGGKSVAALTDLRGVCRRALGREFGSLSEGARVHYDTAS